MENVEKPTVLGQLPSGETIYFTPGKNFTWAFHNQENAKPKE